MKLTSAIVKRWIRRYESNEYQEVAAITAKKALTSMRYTDSRFWYCLLLRDIL